MLEKSAQPHNVAGPFIHRPGDDDSSAITFWSRKGLRDVLSKAIEAIDDYHVAKQAAKQPMYEDETEED